MLDIIVTMLAIVLLVFIAFIMGGSYAKNHTEKYAESKIDCIKLEREVK